MIDALESRSGTAVRRTLTRYHTMEERVLLEHEEAVFRKSKSHLAIKAVRVGIPAVATPSEELPGCLRRSGTNSGITFSKTRSARGLDRMGEGLQRRSGPGAYRLNGFFGKAFGCAMGSPRLHCKA